MATLRPSLRIARTIVADEIDAIAEACEHILRVTVDESNGAIRAVTDAGPVTIFGLTDEEPAS